MPPLRHARIDPDDARFSRASRFGRRARSPLASGFVLGALVLAALLGSAGALAQTGELSLRRLEAPGGAASAAPQRRNDLPGALAPNPATPTVPGPPRAQPPGAGTRPGQLPDSRIATGARDIAAAWLARPTSRYPHAVLGDDLEASQLVVEMRDGRVFNLELPPARVFEDLEPRLVDLDGDGRDEIVLVESDARLGASLAVYGVGAGGLARRSASEFIGQSNRWLNPVGAGDFDGDGRLDLAVVATPHIGGILRLYRYAEPTLLLFAELRGVSTHRIGSTELGLGRIVSRRPRDRLLLPDQSHRRMLLLEWTAQGIVVVAGVDLPARLDGSLVAIGGNRWTLGVEGGERFELTAR